MAENSTGRGDQQAPTAQPERPRISRTRPPDTPTFYANNASFRTLFWDFAMDFGYVVDIDDEAGLTIRDTVTVVMSPQHVVLFSQVLANQISRYEEQFGPIPRAPERELAERNSNEDEPGGE